MGRFFRNRLPEPVDAVLSRAARELAESPGALGAVEIAVNDAAARAAGVPFYKYWNPGATATPRITDLSLPILSVDEARERATQAAADGFRSLKLKVGVGDIAEDVARVRAVAESAPLAKLRLDGNQAFTADGALKLFDGFPELWERIELFEQPTAASDDAAMREVHRALPGTIPVLADESCHDAADATRLIEQGICGGVVLKLAKSGILGAAKIARAAHDAGGVSLFGCMMETRIGIGAALQLSVALGESVVPLLDLDGHLLTNDGGLVAGGFAQVGDILTVDETAHGLGVTVL